VTPAARRQPRKAEPAPRAGARLAWFHCFAGIAGDMALGSLIDAGADLAELRDMLRRVPIGGWSLEAVPVLRSGLAATRAVVTVDGDDVVRTYPHVLSILEEARLPERVRARSIAAFSALASVEGRLHRRPASQVHFHELGAHDTIVDIVGTAIALELLEVDEVAASPVATGSGVVRTVHGVLPNPSPAVLELLAGAPLSGHDLNVELTTPTGAAILASLATSFGPLPPIEVETTGYGAGEQELDGLPNCTQVVIGRRREPALREPGGGQPLALLEANVDDATGEQLADAVDALLAAGAADAWLVPVVMKKGRPGHIVAALADVALLAQLRRVLVDETGSFGVRTSLVDRWAAPRRFEHVEVDGHPVRVKVGPGRAKAEHDDAAAVARRLKLPVREVTRRAEQAWWKRHGGGPPDEAT